MPTMLRIGGAVSTSESNGATSIQIFFDDSMDASNFYNTNRGKRSYTYLIKMLS
jgi:hypothetical protein